MVGTLINDQNLLFCIGAQSKLLALIIFFFGCCLFVYSWKKLLCSEYDLKRFIDGKLRNFHRKVVA